MDCVCRQDLSILHHEGAFRFYKDQWLFLAVVLNWRRRRLLSHLSVKDVDRLDAVLDHPDGSVEGAHDV